jgi:hypothetical protein
LVKGVTLEVVGRSDPEMNDPRRIPHARQSQRQQAVVDGTSREAAAIHHEDVLLLRIGKLLVRIARPLGNRGGHHQPLGADSVVHRRAADDQRDDERQQ